MKSAIIICSLAVVWFLGTAGLAQESTREEREQKIAALRAKLAQQQAELAILKAQENELRSKIQEQHPGFLLESEKPKETATNQQGQKNIAEIPTKGISRDDICGVWKRTEPVPDNLVGFTEYAPDGRCLQVYHMVQQGKSRWVYVVSKWGFDKALWQEVVRCSWPDLKPGTRTEVSLEALTKDHMIYWEEGKKVEEIRSEMPIDFRRHLDEYLAQKDVH